MRERLRRILALRALWWRWKLRLTDYEPETRALPLLVPRGAVCVDAGGNIGQYAYYLAKLAGIVHSFEPLAYNRGVFARVIRAPNVVLHPQALGSKPGTLRIEVTDGNIGTAHVAAEGEQAEVVALDEWGADLERLDFLKIDVEGYELEVLRGAARLIERFHPAILCEITGLARRYGREPEESFAFLRERGYRAHVWDGGLLAVDGRRDGFINYVFLR